MREFLGSNFLPCLTELFNITMTAVAGIYCGVRMVSCREYMYIDLQYHMN